MTYVMSDIHGAYEQFLSLLSQINLGEDDILYIAGDLVDYGEKGMELVGDLSVRLNVYPVAGDHDYTAARMLHGFDKLLRAAEAGENADPDPDYIAEMSAWVRDGGQPTLDGFRTLNSDEREGVLDYLGDLPPENAYAPTVVTAARDFRRGAVPHGLRERHNGKRSGDRERNGYENQYGNGKSHRGGDHPGRAGKPGGSLQLLPIQEPVENGNRGHGSGRKDHYAPRGNRQPRGRRRSD